MGKTEKDIFLIQEINIKNFMLHKDTQIKFYNKPILLITGANGSGKTQILDALILCLGYHPNRLKKGKVANLVGPFDKKAEINLLLYNPIIEGRRAINIPDTRLLKILDTDFPKILIEIYPDRGIGYYIINKGKKHHVLQKEIREIFNFLYICPENKLAFTEEGTVNVFTDQSNKQKLDLLLDTLGLTKCKESLSEALEELNKAMELHEPLKNRLTLEREHLKQIEKYKKEIEEKEKLEKRYKEINLEEAWSEVNRIRQEIDKTQKELEEVRENVQSLLNELKEKKELQKKIEENLKKEETILKNVLEEKYIPKKTTLAYLKGKNSLGSEVFPKLNNILNDVKEVISIVSKIKLSNKDKERIKFLSNKLEKGNEVIIQIKQNINKNNFQIENLEKELEKISKEQVVRRKIIRNFEEEVKHLEKDIIRIEERLKTVEKQITKKVKRIEDLEERLKVKKEIAEKVGNPPEKIRDLKEIHEEKNKIKGRLEGLKQKSIFSMSILERQINKVKALEEELKGYQDHIQKLKENIEEKFKEWHTLVKETIKNITNMMNILLYSVIEEVRIKVENIENPNKAGLDIEIKRHGERWLSLNLLSGGEKVVTVEALILSLHLQTYSPLHAIDECTQRLDMKFKAHAFEMVYHTINLLKEKLTKTNTYSPQFILLAPDTLGLDFSNKVSKYFHKVVLSAVKIGKNKKVSLVK